jgi:hypothetical protein
MIPIWRIRVRRAVAGLSLYMRARPQGSSASVAAVLAVLVGWLCTSSTYSMGVNWDTAAYAADIGGASPWATLPWNSHYGVGHIYWLAMHLMAWLGLPALDGIRAANALALAWSAAALTFCARALGLRPAMRLVVAGLYLTPPGRTTSSCNRRRCPRWPCAWRASTRGGDVTAPGSARWLGCPA